jgi:signal transduction histidine kinase
VSVRDLLETLRSATDIAGDPARAPLVMTRIVMIGSAALSVIGLLALVTVGFDFELLFLPLGAGSVAAWGWWTLRAGRPRPVPMLVAASVAATLYLVIAMLDGDAGSASDATPIVVVSAAGVIVFLAGGRTARRTLWAMLPLVGLAIFSAQVILDGNPVTVAIDMAAALVILAVTYRLAGQLSNTAHVSRHRFTGLLDTAPVAIFEADLSEMRFVDGVLRGVPRFNESNALAEEIISASLDRGNMSRASDPAFAASSRQIMTKILTIGTLEGSGRIETDDGREFLVSWRALDPSLERVMFCLMDNTPQRRANEALSEQVRARDRFIASISHELRTPLTGALGMMEIVREDGIDQAERNELFDLALGQVRDLSDIVADLLVTARADTGTLLIRAQTIDVAEMTVGVVHSTCDGWLIGEPTPILVTADPVRVRQIVRNLATNAKRYGGSGRRVSFDPAAGAIEVRDDGPPIPDHVVASMFEPYGRAADDSAPTDSVGLGLSVARTLARLMHGEVDYRRDGDESVFRLSLPLSTTTTTT